MSGQGKVIRRYRARATCRIGGLFRRKGEIFSLPELAEVPAHLELLPSVELAKQEAKAQVKPRDKSRQGKVDASNSATPADLGTGEPKGAEEVSSADLLHK